MMYVIDESKPELNHLTNKEWQALGIQYKVHHLFHLLDRPGFETLNTVGFKVLYPGAFSWIMDIRPPAGATFDLTEKVYSYKSSIDGRKISLGMQQLQQMINALDVEMILLDDMQEKELQLTKPYHVLEQNALPSGYQSLSPILEDANAGRLYTHDAPISLADEALRLQTGPICPKCHCPICQSYGRAYFYHLSRHTSALSQRLQQYHNVSLVIAGA